MKNWESEFTANKLVFQMLIFLLYLYGDALSVLQVGAICVN